tara:strand:- start:27 stop:4427 length:4401 start_codon:yes stop_codon:yes gene_type:complete
MSLSNYLNTPDYNNLWEKSTNPQNQQDREEFGFFDYLGDIAAAPFRGIEGAIQGVYNLADYMTFDALPDYDNRLLGKSSTMVGGLVEGISQFAIPFVGVGLRTASAIGKVSGASRALTAAEKAAGAGRGAAAISKGRELGKYAVAGAVTDFAVFDAHEARLSDLIQMAPSLQNPITEYLASDENDSEIEGRLKNAIEGLGVGGLVDVFMQGIRGFRSGMKAKAQGKSPDEVMQAVQDGVVGMRDYQKVVEGREYTSSVAKALNIEEDQASGVVSLIDSLGLDRSSIQFERFDPLVDTGYAKFDDTLVDTRTTQGLVQFKEDGTALITGFRSADVSTGIHEVSHVARRWLLNRNIPEQSRRGISEEELAKVEKWAGVGENGWTRSSEEKFARGFEKYIRDGKSPTKGLQGLFTKLGGWMRDIYQDVSGSQIDIEMNPEIREVMDRLVTRQGLPSRPAPGSVRALAQSDDDAYDLGKFVDDVAAVPKEEALKTPRQRAKEIKKGKDPEDVVGGKVNASRITTEEGVMKMMAHEARDLENVQSKTLAEAAGQGQEGFAEAAKRLEDDAKWHTQATGDNTLEVVLKNAAADDKQVRDAVVKVGAIRNTLKKLAAEMNDLAIKGEGASVDEVATFIRMRQVHSVFLKASVNTGRYIAQALAGRQFVPYIETDTRVMPEELTTGGKGFGTGKGEGEGLGPGKGPGEGEGLGPGKGPGDGPGKGPGLGPGKGPGKGEGYGGKRVKGTVLKEEDRAAVDWARAQRQMIEEMGDGDFDLGLKRVRSQMKKFAEAHRNDQTGGSALKLLRKKDNALVSYWMNAILSGPSTHMVNIASGLATTLFLPLERAIGRAMDEKSLSAMAEELSTYMYLWESFTDAMGAARMAFKEGDNRLDPNVRVMEIQSKNPATQINPDTDDMSTAAKKWLGGLANSPSRFLTAEDEFFKQLNYRAHAKRELWKKVGNDPQFAGNRSAQAAEVNRLYEQMVKDDQMYSEKNVLERAHAEASAKGLEEYSDEYNDYVKKYLYRNWNQDAGQIAERAREIARSSTFTTPLSGDRGVVVGVSKSVNEIINKYPSLRFVVPFVRTPTNLLKFYLDRSPVALKELLNPEFRKSMSTDPAVRADFYGRLATGSVGLFGMIALARGEMITGKGPDNKHERDALMRTGWQPYSIKVGDQYVSYRRLDPFATFLGLAADFNETMAAAASNNDQESIYELEGLLPAIAIAAGKNVASKSYLTGLTRVFDAVSNPTQGGTALIEQFAASFVPAAVSQTGTAFGDGDLREINGLLDAVRSRIPGLSADLDPRRNFLGQTMKHPGQGELYSPFTYSTGGSSVISKEISAVGHGFMPPSSMKNGVELKDYKNRKGQSAYDRWLELQGSVKMYGRTLENELERLFKSSAYKRLPYESLDGLDKSPRVSAINRVVAKYRAKAFSQMLSEFPEVQRRDEIGALIKTYRRSGRTAEANQLLALIEDQ